MITIIQYHIYYYDCWQLFRSRWKSDTCLFIISTWCFLRTFLINQHYRKAALTCTTYILTNIKRLACKHLIIILSHYTILQSSLQCVLAVVFIILNICQYIRTLFVRLWSVIECDIIIINAIILHSVQVFFTNVIIISAAEHNNIEECFRNQQIIINVFCSRRRCSLVIPRVI